MDFKVRYKTFLIVTGALIVLSSCKKVENDYTNIELKRALIKSNSLQRKAHIENNATLLADQIADSMLTVQKGTINHMSNKDIKKQFEHYFNQVKYTSWDDIQKPLINISSDKKFASVYVQKLIDMQYIDESNNLGEHMYSLFAWNAQYKLENEKWKIYENTSNQSSLTKSQADKLPINLSDLYAEVYEKDLVPEGVAYDNNTGITYLSSTYKQKIIAVKPDGSYYDFKDETEDGLWSTVGMEVDETTNTLWVVSLNGNEVQPMKYPDVETEWISKIYAFDLITGKLINSYSPKTSGNYGFNDLCVGNDDKIYITDSLNNKVYVLNPVTSSFEEIEINHNLFKFPNGITLSGDEFLYISCLNGIIQYNLTDGTYLFLDKELTLDTNRIDGLAYYQGTLIANQPYRKRIIQFTLNEESATITGQKILEANNPHFDQPSTGQIAGNHYIYLANAQMRSAFENGVIKSKSELENIVLLKLELTN